MGISDGGGKVDAKIAKCILNLDAYIRIQGGSDKVRAIQQWLNGQYWQRDAYSIGPCDGIYSRDVQKALMIGIQYELGLSANGNFGPGTQAGLKQHPLKLGDSGIFVQLFSAACVFNEPVGDPANSIRTEQQTVYSESLASFVRSFQHFPLLNESGNADYQTWAQLLVSMGDADRPATGCDTRFEVTTEIASWLQDSGYRIVGRYLYDPPSSSLDKEIKPGELQTIFDAGLRVFPIFQDNARELEDFSFGSGVGHGMLAHDLAADYGFNQGTVIYFAVDYDATQTQIDSAIVPYFEGVRRGLEIRGLRYHHGVYGSRNVCSKVTASTFARSSFVSGMSWGFSGNLGFPLPENWAFNQIKEIKVTATSEAFDLDREVWRDTIDPGSSSVLDSSGPADTFIEYVGQIYEIGVAYSGNASSASQLTIEYLRHKSYGDYKFDILIGPYDKDFVALVKQNLDLVESFVDPVTGYEISSAHMMATANAHLLIPTPPFPQLANGGDVGGWAGDLMTLYVDWRLSEEEYQSGHAFCLAKMGQPNVSSSFGFADMIEDADGFMIAQRLRDGQTIVEAVESLYGDQLEARSRFDDFVNGRWGDITAAKECAHYALTGNEDMISLAQDALIRLGGLILMPIELVLLPGGGDLLDGFEQGFADVLQLRLSD